MVGCVAFGAPRVGNHEIRREAHCIPKIRMTRVSREGERVFDVTPGDK